MTRPAAVGIVRTAPIVTRGEDPQALCGKVQSSRFQVSRWNGDVMVSSFR
jgi:hypothetical protein